MDEDDILYPDVTTEEFEKLAIENACNLFQSSFATSSKASSKPVAFKKLGSLQFIDEIDAAMY